MNLDEILKYCNIVLNKDQSGNSLSPVQFNTLLNAVNEEMLDYYYREYARTSQAMPVDFQRRILASSPISKFITNASFTPFQGNVAMPDDARYVAAAISFRQGVMRNVEMFHDEPTFAVVKNSLLHRDITTNPVGIQRNRVWEFLPKNIETVDIAYFRNPATPYYDTAIDADDNVLYLLPTYYLVSTGTVNYFDVMFNNGVVDVLVSLHVLYTGQQQNVGLPAGTIINPLTVELEWDKPMHIVFSNRILERMGVNIRDEFVFKYTDKKNAEGTVN